jgi:citrate lyase gamma subunit
MATRMQQRRGTAAQWTAANPILAAGEIGFETDTSKFKMGNGSSTWENLQYFANASELSALIGGADEFLDTLGELAAAIDDDPQFYLTIGTTITNHANASTLVHGIADTSLLATTGDVNTAASAAASALGDHESLTTLVHGIADTSLLATTGDVNTAASAAASALSDHESLTQNVHGIGDVAELVTQEQLTDAISGAEVDQSTLVGYGLSFNSVDVEFDVDTTVIATNSYVDDAVTDHNNLTENVHGIADTSLLATTAYADSAEADAITAAGTAADTKISTAVAALTKSSVGLANVDNTADADKPVSTATQTALNLKANLAGPTFTGTVTADDLIVEGDLTVTGTTTTINATDLSITDPLIYLASNQYTEDVLDVGFLAATGAPGGTEEDHLHSGFFRDASDSKKWKLVSNVPHPVGNVVDITNATKETLVVGALEATTVNPSSGVVFSDGTQTKEGVPSRTPIVQKSASYALSTLTHRDSMIEVSSTDPTTITVPLDSTVDYPIGTTIDILQTNTGQVTIAPVSVSVTVNATPGLKLRTRWSSATLMKRAANTWVVYGDLTA